MKALKLILSLGPVSILQRRIVQGARLVKHHRLLVPIQEIHSRKACPAGFKDR